MGRRKSPERLEAERLEREYNEQLDRRVEQIKSFIDDHKITDGLFIKSAINSRKGIIECERSIRIGKIMDAEDAIKKYEKDGTNA